MTLPTNSHSALSTLLIQVKLTPPIVRGVLVARPQLIAQLNHGLTRSLTLLAAPAGSGKSTLVAEWLRNRLPAKQAPACVWFSVDEGDNDPLRFFGHLIAGLRQIEERLAHELQALLSTPGATSSANLADVTAALLLNALSAYGGTLILVLDDYHRIADKRIHAFLQVLLDYPSPHLHLILISRTQPPLALARLRVRNQLTELGSNELFFTPAEIATFYHDVMELDLPDSAVEELTGRTEGWVAALQLAGLSLRNTDDADAFIRSFRGSDRHVVDYLLEDVLHALPPHLYEFLLQTSILERLHEELCAAVIEPTRDSDTSNHHSSDVRSTLADLDERNLFLLPLDNQRHWYRYHHLFADFLYTQLQQDRPAEIPLLHRRASAWYQAQGLLEDAIGHALSAGDVAQAAALMEQVVGEMLWRRGEVTRLRQWLDALPADAYDAHPYLLLMDAWLHYLAGAGRAVDRRLDRLEALLESSEMVSLVDADGRDQSGYIDILRAERALVHGLLAQGERYFAQADAALERDDFIGRGFVTHGQGLIYSYQGRFSEAEKAFRDAQRISQRSQNPTFRKLVLYDLGILQTWQGDLAGADRLLSEAAQLELTLDAMGNPLAGAVQMALGMLRYEQDRLDDARHHLERGIARWQRHPMPGMSHLGQIYLAQILWLDGEREAASTFLDRAVAGWRGLKTPLVRSYIGLHLARAAFKQGNGALLAEWSAAAEKLSGQNTGQSTGTLLANTEAFLLQRHRWSQGESDCALEPLLVLRAEAADAHWHQNVLEIDLLMALLAQEQGDASAARRHLAHALQRGQVGEYVRSFVDEGAPMAALLQHQPPDGIDATYLGKLQASFMNLAPNQPTAQQILLDPLTRREIQVLQRMALGLTNREIADELIIALGTVAKYSNNIFTKLGVPNRTGAINRARELGIL